MLLAGELLPAMPELRRCSCCPSALSLAGLLSPGSPTLDHDIAQTREQTSSASMLLVCRYLSIPLGILPRGLF